MVLVIKMKDKKYVLIAGCRDYNDYKTAKAYIDFCISNIRKKYDIIIISGGARGADALGEQYADENKFKVKRFLPDWERYGKSAGPRRNKLMVEAADYIICFWDGNSPGTGSTIKYAQSADKPLRIKFI